MPHDPFQRFSVPHMVSLINTRCSQCFCRTMENPHIQQHEKPMRRGNDAGASEVVPGQVKAYPTLIGVKARRSSGGMLHVSW